MLYQIYSNVIGNNIVIITNFEKKRELIRLYMSQMKTRDWVNFNLGLNAWKSRFLSKNNNQFFAELFFNITVSEFLRLRKKFYND